MRPAAILYLRPLVIVETRCELRQTNEDHFRTDVSALFRLPSLHAKAGGRRPFLPGPALSVLSPGA